MTIRTVRIRRLSGGTYEATPNPLHVLRNSLVRFVAEDPVRITVPAAHRNRFDPNFPAYVDVPDAAAGALFLIRPEQSIPGDKVTVEYTLAEPGSSNPGPSGDPDMIIEEC